MVKFPSFVNRFVLPLVLFLLFFYFFGLSSLKKGSEKDVVVVGNLYHPFININFTLLYIINFTLLKCIPICITVTTDRCQNS